jgi:hypothetical protein
MISGVGKGPDAASGNTETGVERIGLVAVINWKRSAPAKIIS